MHGTIGETEVQTFRVVRRRNDWTLKEHEIVISHWPDINEIAKRLPHRTRTAIANFAGRCNLRRQQHHWTQVEDQKLRRMVKQGIPRRDIAKELKLSLNQVASRMAYANVRYGRSAPAPTGNALMDSVLNRAFELNMSRKDLDALCNSRSAFARWSPARRIHNRHLWRAVKELGGHFTVEWNDE